MIISQIEKAALEFELSGETERWFEGCDDKVKEVCLVFRCVFLLSLVVDCLFAGFEGS